MLFAKPKQCDIDLHAGYVMVEGHKIDHTCTDEDFKAWFPHFYHEVKPTANLPYYSGPCSVKVGDFEFNRVEFIFGKRDDGSIHFDMLVLHTNVLRGRERKQFFKIARPYTTRPQVIDTSWGFQMDNGSCLLISRDESPAFISMLWE